MKMKIWEIIILVAAIMATTAWNINVNTDGLMAIGDNGENGQLYVPAQVLEGPDGNIYVLDAKDSFIKVYSGEGMYLRRMGGRGQGPGEMMRQGTFGFAGKDRLFFTEMINGHRWITFMKLDGSFDRVLKIHLGGPFGAFRAKMLPGNRMLAEMNYWGATVKRSGYYGNLYRYRLAVINSEGKIENDVIDKSHLFSVCLDSSGGDKRVPFFPEFLWDLDTEGTIVYSSGNLNELQHFDLKGNQKRTVKTSLPNAPAVTDADLDQWRSETRARIVKKSGTDVYNKYYKVIEKYRESVYKTKPVYRELAITPGGNILVKGATKDESGSRTYWLIDKAGKVLKEFDSTAVSITVSTRYILYIIKNEDGDRLVYCLPRKGDETEDLRPIEI